MDSICAKRIPKLENYTRMSKNASIAPYRAKSKNKKKTNILTKTKKRKKRAAAEQLTPEAIAKKAADESKKKAQDACKLALGCLKRTADKNRDSVKKLKDMAASLKDTKVTQRKWLNSSSINSLQLVMLSQWP